jgi:hypothetical protein
MSIIYPYERSLLMENKTVYPEWVQNYRTQGKTVKKIGNTYYLYKRTSKRVPGKKYPQPVDTYIGVITPEGIIQSGKKKISLTEIEVKEYGFSKALWTLCPQSWKTPLGDDWEDILSIIIQKWSPESYLSKEREAKKEEDFRCQFAAQMGMLTRKILLEHGIKVAELEPLKSIFLVYMEKETVVSKINGDQKLLLDKAGIDLGHC